MSSDSISICKQPHLHDGIRAMLLAFPVFFLPIFLLDLKIVVRTIVIQNVVVPLADEMTVFVYFFLDIIALLGQHT